ncbi:MAG: carbon-nitrogen hydrolase family protein [Candidatus Eremiobacteraeota bacterium]|nr:carbon-nitrogen hydrolase family protein [Candidatus Eremiobacteraeota bacterium]
MRERQIPVACVQLAAIDRRDFEERWEHVLALTESAARDAAQLIVLPEGTVPGYVLGSDAVCTEQIRRAGADLAAIARRYGATIVYGGIKMSGGRTLNAAIALGPDGRELGFAAKQFLWHFDRRWFAPGETLEPIDTPIGRLGLLVCADGRIPTIASTLVERGAQILVMPTAWVTSGRDPAVLENIQADLMVNVRARENGVPFVACNKSGVELGAVAYCGKSTIVAADGTTSARASERKEEILTGEALVARQQAPCRGARLAAAQRSAVTDRDESAPDRVRIAFTLEREPAELVRLSHFAADADFDVVLAGGVTSATAIGAPTGAAPCGPAGNAERARGGPAGDVAVPIAFVANATSANARTTRIAGIRAAVAGDEIVHDPRGLVETRRSGIDLIVWDTRDDPAWQIRFARTRAAELRAYVIVFDRGAERAFAVDPAGAMLAGTFGEYRLASFLYERALTQATLVAPATDVAEGLRVAERIRAEGLAPLRTD